MERRPGLRTCSLIPFSSTELILHGFHDRTHISLKLGSCKGVIDSTRSHSEHPGDTPRPPSLEQEDIKSWTRRILSAGDSSPMKLSLDTGVTGRPDRKSACLTGTCPDKKRFTKKQEHASNVPLPLNQVLKVLLRPSHKHQNLPCRPSLFANCLQSCIYQCID